MSIESLDPELHERLRLFNSKLKSLSIPSKDTSNTKTQKSEHNILVGNTVKQQKSSEKYHWKLFVTCEDESIIESVTFRLHPTFSPSKITIRESPFTLKRIGWGTFDIDIKVKLASSVGGQTLKVTHPLSFDDSSGSCRFDGDPVACQAVHTISTLVAPATPEAQASPSPNFHAESSIRRMSGVSSVEMHGHMGDRSWLAPRLVTHCDTEARPGYQSMKAHEYDDEPTVLRQKVKLLADMIRRSENCVAYTGAGISTAAGISDYATKAGTKSMIAKKGKKKKTGFAAIPTLGHRTLTALHHAGFLKHWVQQNHDGLPQKAGFPQHHLNEIHGAWHDPSNPVVPMSGSLRGDLYEWLMTWKERSDLTIAMGTSLCGMSADETVTEPATKYLEDGVGLGAVIVSIQRTQYDHLASLRIYAMIDDVAALLAQELALNVLPQTPYTPKLPASSTESLERDQYRVSYDRRGRRTTNGETTIWDLRAGQRIHVTDGPGKHDVGTIIGRTKSGNYRVRLPINREGCRDRNKPHRIYILGAWWVQSAANGKLKKLPFYNTNEPVGMTRQRQ